MQQLQHTIMHTAHVRTLPSRAIANGEHQKYINRKFHLMHQRQRECRAVARVCVCVRRPCVRLAFMRVRSIEAAQFRYSNATTSSSIAVVVVVVADGHWFLRACHTHQVLQCRTRTRGFRFQCDARRGSEKFPEKKTTHNIMHTCTGTGWLPP